MTANDPTAYGTRRVRAGKAGTNSAITSGFCARVRRLRTYPSFCARGRFC